MPRGFIINVFVYIAIMSTLLRGAHAQTRPERMIADGVCPDLSGLYFEEGEAISNGIKSKAHLSRMVAHLENKWRTPLYSNASPHSPPTYYAKKIRVSHPDAGRFSLEAFGQNGQSLGVFKLGHEEGWQCSKGVFYKYYESNGKGGEGGWGDDVIVYQLSRGSDGVLIWSRYFWHQRRSIFVLGAAMGEPNVLHSIYTFKLSTVR